MATSRTITTLGSMALKVRGRLLDRPPVSAILATGTPSFRNQAETMKRIAFLIPLLAGCALNRPYMREVVTTTSTNGVTTTTERLSKATTLGLWPGTASVERQRTSLGKTMSIGQSDIEAQGGGTNMVQQLQALDSIIGKLRP